MSNLISWSARNSVFSNLLMIILIIFGLFSLWNIRSELIPQFSLDRIRVDVNWDGSSPEEVEKGICIKVEESLSKVEGIKKITSLALESRCSTVVQVESWKTPSKVMEDVKDQVNRINTFPEDVERPIITEVKQMHQVIHVSLFGNVSESVLKRKSQEIKDELLLLNGISRVVVGGLRNWEISIEVSEENLRRYNLTFTKLSEIIKKNVLELTGGDIRSKQNRIRIRTVGKLYTGLEFEKLELLVKKDGTILRLGDVATVIDSFDEMDTSGRFNGKPASLISIYRTEDEDALQISEIVKKYVEKKKTILSNGLDLNYWGDTSRMIQDRLSLLLRNGRTGLILVFLSLWLFLNIRLSFWVAMGLPVALMTALGFITFVGGTLNMISMFAFIMVLGILVDDAIVIAENIFSHMQKGENFIDASINGTKEVAFPVFATVTTTIVAFVPLMMVTGTMGKFMEIIPIAVIAALIASVIEAFFILPNHLANWVKLPRPGTFGSRIRNHVERTIYFLIHKIYRPLLIFSLKARYFVLSSGLAVLLLTVGLVLGGHIRFYFFPNFDSDWIQAKLLFQRGTPIEQTSKAMKVLEQAIMDSSENFEKQTGKKVVKQVFTILGEQIVPNRYGVKGSHAAHLIVEMLPSEQRGINSSEIINDWRKRTGEIPGVVSLVYGRSGGRPPGGKPIEIGISGKDLTQLRDVSNILKEELLKYSGVFDIEDDFRPGKMEIQTLLKPQARVLGLNLDDLARQIRSRFFGLQVIRIQRGNDEVKVKLRYPRKERNAISDIENIRIKTKTGSEIPFYEVAKINIVRGLDEIKRVDKKRFITVSGEVNDEVANPSEIISNLKRSILPKLESRFPDVRFQFEGQARESRESISSLGRGFIFASLVIYAILSLLFRSYFQPIVVMSAIPFGFVGAVAGHVIMGYDISILSLMGIVALSGVVVNDSLVFLDFVNRFLKEGFTYEKALLHAGISRWRAIVLTTLTTASGLGPMLLEKSFQAQFLIPMAISLCFGLLFATFITLILVPVISLIGNDISIFFKWIYTGKWLPREKVDSHTK